MVSLHDWQWPIPAFLVLRALETLWWEWRGRKVEEEEEEKEEEEEDEDKTECGTKVEGGTISIAYLILLHIED